jgi:predicted nucleotidyltransferase
VSDEREATLSRLLEDAEQDPDVLGVFVFGSRSRDGFADNCSDYDVVVVVRDDSSGGFQARWPCRHGAPVEVVTATLSEFVSHAEPGTESEWARYQYSNVRVLLDKTGDVARVLDEKRGLPAEARDDLARAAVDGYINFTFRSLRNRLLGLAAAARLDAAESVPYLLTAIFALEGRVRPFNKYLEWELREHPLAEDAWSAERLLPRLEKVLDGVPEDQHALFRDVERVARGHGLNEVIEGWEPDVAWLRGDAPYRA